MTVAEAAALLGVPVNAGPGEVARAFRARARAVHPDAPGGDAEAFIRLAQARDALLAHQPQAAVSAVPVAPFSPRLFATWIGLLVLACLVGASGDWVPLTPLEPIARSLLLVAGLGGYAISGRRAFLVLGLVALAATAVIGVVFATLGSLVGLLLAVAPVYGLLLMGQRAARRRALSGAQARP